MAVEGSEPKDSVSGGGSIISSLNSGIAEGDGRRPGMVGDKNGMGESSSYSLGSSRLDAMASRGDTAVSFARVNWAVIGRIEAGDCMVEMSNCSCMTIGIGMLTIADTGIGFMVLRDFAFTEGRSTLKGSAAA